MLEIRILGPVDVLQDGRALPLGGAKQRALLADLALHANEVVSSDRLVDDLWGGEPPDTSAHMLHVYVSRLRKTLEDTGGEILVTRPPGYLLRVEPPDEVDATRFEAEARSGAAALDRPEEALGILDAALATWRGRALEEFADEPFAQPGAARLEELRATVNEHRVEALLALGRPDEAVVELEGLIARHPLRERLRELQMLALYRAGRQGDALQAFGSARRTLAEELGIDPGPGLVSLEEAILRHDPELGAVVTRPAVVASAAAAAIPPPLEAPPAPVKAMSPEVHEPAAPPPPHDAAPTTRAGAGAHAAAARPGRARWAAIVLAILAALAIVVVLARDTSTERPSDEPSVATGPSTIAWTEVPDPGGHVFGGPGDQVILGGVVTPDGLVAVGNTAARRSTTSGVRDYDAAVWTRDATGTWQRAEAPAFIAPGNQEATDATVVGERIVVVGSDSSSGDHDAAVWTIAAGATGWSRVDPDAPGMREPGDQWVRGVTWTGSHVVAVGANRLHGDDDAAIWVSTDGLDWTLLVPGELGQPGDQHMTTVTMLGDLLVAAGYSEVSGDRDAAVWTSTDGADWEPIQGDALGGEGDQQINAVIAAGPGLVAVGQEDLGGDRDAAVWTSTDGRRWERVEDPGDELEEPGLQQMSGLAVSGSVIVAAGSGVVDREIDGAVWISRDGTTWTREDPTSSEMSTFTDYGRQGVRAIVSTDAGFVAMGREGRGPNDDADVWTGEPSA